MELKVKILAGEEEERRIEVSNGDTYENMLEKLKLNPVEVVVLRDGKPVPEDEEVAITKNKGVISITVIRIVSVG